MSDFIIEITEPDNNVIELNTDIVNNVVELETNVVNIEIINTEKLLASDFPDFYHTKIIDFNSAVSGLIPASSNINIEDIQDIIGLSGIVGGTGIKIDYNDNTGLTTIHTSGLILGSKSYNLGRSYQSLEGLSLISGVSINSPTVLVHCYINGGTP